MCDYVIAIPSYKRPNVIIDKSLKMLKTGGVPASKIVIFVANEEEHADYLESVPKDLYGKIVVGVKGITNQRKFIINYFPEGKCIVSIDDDVEQVEKMNGPNKLVKIKNVDAFFKAAFQELKKNGLYIWGIYPVRNPFFMKPNVSTSLKFIIGTMYGFINRHDRNLEPSSQIKEKEDVEQSILYYLKDGGVLRYNNTTIKTKFHSEGGLGKKTAERFDNNEKAAEYLNKTYPDLVSIFHRKSGMAEIRLASSNAKKTMKKKPKNVKTRKNKKIDIK